MGCGECLASLRRANFNYKGQDMKIVIDLTALSYHITGIERYALCITEKMLDIDKKNEYILLFRNEIYDSFFKYIDDKRIRAKIIYGKNKLLFFQVVLPYALYKIKADCYLFLAFTSPILFKRKKIFNTIHDVGIWDYPMALSRLHKFYFRISCRASARVSQGIITVSQFSQKRIHSVLGVPLNRIKVIPSAIPETLLNAKTVPFEMVKEKYNIPSRYIMSLSTLEPRKNLELLLKAFTKIKDLVDYDLVLVGRIGWKMEEVLSKYTLDSRIHMTGFVDDEDVATIYKNAMCFVFSSIYEGFGLPPLEALALGTPVISSNAASMPEVLMEQAVYFENNDIEDLKKKLVEIKNLTNFMPKGLNEYQRETFSFEQSAKRVLEFIK